MKEKWDRFIMSWNMLVSSFTEEHYNMQFNLFLKEFITYLAALQYVRAPWLDAYNDRFVAAWTDNVTSPEPDYKINRIRGVNFRAN